MTEHTTNAAEELASLIRRVEYIMDPTASASERLARRAHLTGYDMRRILAALRNTQADNVLREALDWFRRHADGLAADVALAHRSRGNGCTEWMRDDDRDFRRELATHLSALKASPATEPNPEGMKVAERRGFDADAQEDAWFEARHRP